MLSAKANPRTIAKAHVASNVPSIHASTTPSFANSTTERFGKVVRVNLMRPNLYSPPKAIAASTDNGTTTSGP